MTIAWVFPGQGSQKSGMAAPVLTLPGAEERFALASRLLGRDLLAIVLAPIPDQQPPILSGLPESTDRLI